MMESTFTVTWQPQLSFTVAPMAVMKSTNSQSAATPASPCKIGETNSQATPLPRIEPSCSARQGMRLNLGAVTTVPSDLRNPPVT